MTTPRPRVLVAEDERVIREVLCLALEDEGYPVQGVEDGMAAMEALAAWRPHLLILDMMMPRMDGWGVLSELQHHPNFKPENVIVLSASRQAVEDARKLGAGTAILKPFDVEKILELVAERTAKTA